MYNAYQDMQMWKLSTVYHIRHDEFVGVIFTALKNSVKNKGIPGYSALL